jgi:tRNA(Ile)-lysidine synthetase-like protein
MDALLLVAVSGGQDSLCLLDALHDQGPSRSVRLAVLHVDHQLRGAEAAEDSAAVGALCARLGWPFVAVKVDVASYARQHHLGLEEAGRKVRYQALAASARDLGAVGAATGHTLDDLAETTLINLLRGTGPLGLSGIAAVQHYRVHLLGHPIPELWERPPAHDHELMVVRPLLDTRRDETLAYCQQLGLPYRTDTSNDDPRFLRNRIRHHLIPELRTYNPSIVPGLGRLARLIADDEAELRRLVDDVWQTGVAVREDEIFFSWSTWLAASPSIQRRLLRRSQQLLSGSEAGSFQAIEDARLLLGRRVAGRRLSLGFAVDLVATGNGFRLIKTGDSDLPRAHQAGGDKHRARRHRANTH